jgi:ketosteroid isomerase-like protein
MATQADTRSILDHQYEAFSAGSADEVIKDFAEDAVLIRADKVFEGRDQVHAAYSEMFARLFKPGTYEFTLDAEHVIGDIAYIAWHASCASDEITLGADTFMVRNGKIVAQTYTAKVEPKTA